MIFDKGIRRMRNETQFLTMDDPAGWRTRAPDSSKSGAMKLSAVNRCVEVLSDSLAKLPSYIMLEGDKRRLDTHPVLNLLEGRPNELMAPAVYKNLMEANRLLCGNAFALIVRSGYSARPVELLPIPGGLVQLRFDDNGHLWYVCTNPKTKERRRIPQWDMLHYKAFSYDGITGVSVLSRAADVVAPPGGRRSSMRAASTGRMRGLPAC